MPPVVHLCAPSSDVYKSCAHVNSMCSPAFSSFRSFHSLLDYGSIKSSQPATASNELIPVQLTVYACLACHACMSVQTFTDSNCCVGCVLMLLSDD
jgi:hypothetical protein